MKHDITTKLARRALAPRREPYWMQIDQALYLGYRRSASSEVGTWVARWRDPVTGKQHYNSLGSHLEIHEPRRQAVSWRDQISATGRKVAWTVKDACEAYLADFERTGKIKTQVQAKRILDREVCGRPIAKISIDHLKPHHLIDWQNSLTGKATSRNRYTSSLVAALNFCHRRGDIVSDIAWRSLEPIADTDSVKRDRWLDADERQRLLAASPPLLSAFLQGLMLLACRPGELSAAVVSDFDSRAGTLKLSGKTGPRVIPLSTVAVVLISAHADGKSDSDPIFPSPTGIPWRANRLGEAVAEAVRVAGLDGVTAYTLRHTAISELIASGMDAFTVARMAGTSTNMIDKTYGHLCPGRTREKLNAVSLI